MRSVWAVVRAAVGLEELILSVGLGLLAVGFWLWWLPGAFLAPGAVLLWIGLPVRRRFVEPPPAAIVRRKR